MAYVMFLLVVFGQPKTTWGDVHWRPGVSRGVVKENIPEKIWMFRG